MSRYFRSWVYLGLSSVFFSCSGLKPAEENGPQRSQAEEESSSKGGVTPKAATKIEAPSSSPVRGSTVSFPAGSIAFETSVTISEAAPLTTAAAVSEISKDAKVLSAGPAVLVSSRDSVDATTPFTIAIALPPVPAGLVGMADPYENLVVLYRIEKADGTFATGVIPRGDLTISDSSVAFPASHFGAYQAAYMSAPLPATAVGTTLPPTPKTLSETVSGEVMRVIQEAQPRPATDKSPGLIVATPSYISLSTAGAITSLKADSALSFTGVLQGDVTGSMGATSVSSLAGRPFSSTAPSAGEILAYDGAQWKPQALIHNGLRAGETASSPSEAAVAQALSSKVEVISANTTLAVPSAAYPDLGSALAYLGARVISPGALVTVQIADGTYTYATPILFEHQDCGRIKILGNATTPASVVLRYSGSGAFMNFLSRGCTLGGVTLQSMAAAQTGVLADMGGSAVLLGSVRIDSFDVGISAQRRSLVTTSPGLQVTNANMAGALAVDGTVALSGTTITSVGQGLYAQLGGVITVASSTVSGSFATVAMRRGVVHYIYTTSCTTTTTASTTAFYVALGGYIEASSCAGSTNIPANTLGATGELIAR